MRSIKRIVSMVLTVVMLLGMIPTQTVSALSLKDLMGTQNTVEPAMARNDDFSLQLEWKDNNSNTALNINESQDVRNAATLRVNYTCMNVRPEGYKAGDLVITVKGIGDVQRGSTLEALVGADKINSGNKTHDWSYSWNRANDTYTLTNNKDISGGSVLSGYFELTWGLESRNCKTNYTQSDISASMYLPEGQPLTTPALSFSHNTTKDTFAVNIAEQDNMYGYQGLTDGIQNPDDYAWVKYEIDTTMTRKARGAYGQRLVIDPDADNIGSGAICLNPNLTIQDNHDGTFSIFGLRDWDSSLNYIDQSFTLYVAYPKDQYATEHVKLNVQRVGHWYDESDENAVLAEKQIDKTIPGDFSFDHFPGSLYRMWLDTHYYDHSMHLGDIYGPGMQNNYSDYFYMNLALNAEGNPHTAEMVVDNFYITTKDDYRALNADEYELTSISIPSAQSIENLNGVSVEADTMSVEIYTAQNGTKIDPQNSEPFKTGPITTSGSTINLPENTTAVAVILKDVTDNILQASFTVKATFHTKQNTDNLDSGKLVPVAFIRIYNQEAEGTKFGSWVNTATEDDYTDTTELHLADRDKNTYGSYLIREKTEITFFGETPDYQKALIQAEALEQVDRHYETTVKVSGRFSYDYTNPPDNYTLYTILPARYSLKGYTVPEDIYDIIKTSIPTTSIDVDTNYRNTGLTYIAMHFNQPVDGTVSASIPVKTDRNEDIKIYGVLMNHVPVDANVGSQLDNGKWSENQALYSDLNNDGNSDEKLSYESTMIRKALAADSSELSIKKYVQSQYSDGFTQAAPAEFNGDYTYELSIRTGNGKATNLVVTDILEAAEGSEWHGFLKSVDLSQCEALGIKGTVKYSTSATPGDSSSSSWTTNPENARAIMVDFSGSVINPGTELNILVHMTAPNETALKNKKACNTFHADFDLQDATRPGSEPVHQALDSSQTAAMLTHSLETIVITKEDEVDKTRLEGAVFELYDTENPELMIATATTNANGYAIFHYIPSDHTYILREVRTPSGYLPVEDQTIEVKAETLRLTIQDPRKPGAIEINKNSGLTSLPLENAEFAVFDKNTDEQVGTSVFTDSQGYAKIENIPWGNYYLKEINAPNGYITSDETYEFSVTRESVEQTPPIFRINNDQEPTKLAVLKTNDQNQPLSGAILELVYQVNESSSFRYGLYVTDTNGRVDIEDLPYGSYILKEYRAPAGYEKFEEFKFDMQPDSPVLGDDGYHTIAVTAKDARKKGSVTIVKNDDIGNQIADIEFTLYDQENHEVGKAITNEAGVAKIDGLEWGSYILKETDAPDYYEIDEEGCPVEITASNLDIQLTIVNATQKGSVVMTKYDETETDKLEGAVYSLYSAAGGYLGDYTTGADGTLAVENLAWGSYYFKEKKAPAGYGLSDETIRFSINANNSTTIQELTATDKEMTSSITITKTIDANDINFANGNPTFIFKATNTQSNTADATIDPDEPTGPSSAAVTTSTDNNQDTTSLNTEPTYIYTNNWPYPVVNAPNEAWNVSYPGAKSLVLTFLDVPETENSNFVEEAIPDSKGRHLWEVQYDNTPIQGSGEYPIPTDGLEPFYSDLHTPYNPSTVEPLYFSATDYKAHIYDGNGNPVQTDLCLVHEGTTITIPGDTAIITTSIPDRTEYTPDGITYSFSTGDTDHAPMWSCGFGAKIEPVYDDETPTPSTGNEVFYQTVVFDEDYVKSHTDENGKVSIDVTFTDLPQGIYEISELDTSRYANEQITNVVNGKVQGEKVIINLTSDDSISGVATVPTGAAEFINDNYEAQDYSHTDLRTNILSERQKLTSISVDYEDSIVDAGSSVDHDKLTVIANYDDGTSRTLNSNEYHLNPEIFSTVNGEYTIDVDFTDNGITRHGNFTVNINNGVDCIISLEATYINKQPLNVGDSITPDMFTVKATANTGKVRILKTNEYLVWMPDEDTAAIATDELNDVRIVLNIDNGGYDVSTTVTNIPAIKPQPILQTGADFNTNIKDDTTAILFTNAIWPDDAELIDVSAARDNSVVAWYVGTTMYVRAKNSNDPVIANASCRNMFYYKNKLTTIDLSNLDTSGVTNMSFMFGECSGLTSLNVTKFDTSNVTDMSYMFYYCSGLTSLDLSNFDTSSVTDMNSMFRSCSGLTTLNLSKFETSSVTDMSYMFRSCSGLTSLDLSNFDTSSVTDMSYMFRSCYGLTSLNVTNFDTSSVTDMSYMFYNCYGLTSLNVTNFDTSGVTDMSYMFRSCSGLTTLNLSKFETSSVTDISYMFYNCDGLTSLDLSSFDTSSVTDMSYMFRNCFGLTYLDLSNFDTSSVTNMSYMFRRCYYLTYLDLSSFDTSSVTNMSYMFYDCFDLSTAYARTQADADKFNSSSNKPSNVNFIVKP